MTNKEKARDYTDEEKAIIYTHNRPIEYSEILSQPYVVDEIRKAYIAGLKAGRPKWHKVADGDLPKENTKYWVLTSEREPKVDSWLDISWVNSYDVIAWKEIILP